MNTMTISHIKAKDRHARIEVDDTFFDVYIFELGLHWQVSNDASRIKELLTKLDRYKHIRLLVGATNSYSSYLQGHALNAKCPPYRSAPFPTALPPSPC